MAAGRALLPPRHRQRSTVLTSLLLLATGTRSAIVVTDYADLEGPAVRGRAALVVAEKVGYLDSEPRLLLFGGTDEDGKFFDDFWELDLGFIPPTTVKQKAKAVAAKVSIDTNPTGKAKWRQIGSGLQPRPAGRARHSMVTTAEGVVVLFGGTASRDGTTAMNDLWKYDAKLGTGK